MGRDDLSAYIIVVSVVILMLLGKYLMFKEDEPIDEVIEEGKKELEEEINDIKENIKKVI